MELQFLLFILFYLVFCCCYSHSSCKIMTVPELSLFFYSFLSLHVACVWLYRVSQKFSQWLFLLPVPLFYLFVICQFECKKQFFFSFLPQQLSFLFSISPSSKMLLENCVIDCYCHQAEVHFVYFWKQLFKLSYAIQTLALSKTKGKKNSFNERNSFTKYHAIPIETLLIWTAELKINFLIFCEILLRWFCSKPKAHKYPKFEFNRHRI